MAYVVCNDKDFDAVAIDNIGFSSGDSNHGITYIETGNNAGITIYEEKGTLSLIKISIFEIIF
jgi:hypothetical protein